MSVYQPKDKAGRPRSPFFLYDFCVRVRGRKPATRFHGSTGLENRKAAAAYEAKLKILARDGQISDSYTVDEACRQYWEEIGQYMKSASSEAKNLELISRFLGPDTALVSITPQMVVNAAAGRLNTPIERKRRACGGLVMAPTRLMPKPSTVNRQIVQPLRRLMKRAKRVWGVPLDLEAFDWGALRYEEDAERVRELSMEEELRFWQALRPDYAPICELYIISGRRRSDWVDLKKFKVDRTAGTVRFPTRKRKRTGELLIELTPRELEIILEEWSKAPACEFVFTYEVQRGPDRGQRRPITAGGLRAVTDRAFKKADIQDFRRHDFRHTFASRALRGKGDLRTLMAAMDHQDIKSTVRYAHMARGQVSSMRERVQTLRKPAASVTPMRREKEG